MMQCDRASKRGWWLSILLAGVVGFLVGDWHAATPGPTDVLAAPELSASQNVALRFPDVKGDGVADDAATDTPTRATGAAVLGGAQLALLSPEPMLPPPSSRIAQTVPPAPVPAAPLEEATPAPAAKALPATPPVSAATPPRAEVKSAADGASRHANRPGFLLNDAQIASIKGRLHLTPDQQRMWPAVEAALRNIAYAKTRYAYQHGGGARGGSLETASLDPDSAAVQGLKSAAVPLIMSFSDEQKNEVRSLAHVMGLDKLASEF